MPQFPGPYTLGHIKRTTASHWTELPEYRDATRAIDAHLLDAAIEAGWCKTTVETDDAARSVAVRLIARLNMSPTEVDRLDAEEVIAMLRAETDSGSNSGSDGSPENRVAVEIKPPYPSPANYERDQWLYSRRLEGATIETLRNELEGKKDFQLITGDTTIRDAIKRFCEHHGLTVPKGSPGRPKKT